VNQLQGIGDIKLGATRESFDQDSLQPMTAYSGDPPSMLSFQDSKTDPVSWGNLHPKKIELRFYYGQLIGIRLYFNEEIGDLIAVDRALTGKYGCAPTGMLPFADGTNSGCQQWTTPGIQMSVALPYGIPVGMTPDYLHQRMTGIVDLLDAELINKLSREKLDAVQQELLKNHDIEKIKANL
jgi:hypothetical protein